MLIAIIIITAITMLLAFGANAISPAPGAAILGIGMLGFAVVDIVLIVIKVCMNLFS